MVLNRGTIEIMSKHYGVRIMYRSTGPPIVEVSQRAKKGHGESVEHLDGDISRVLMMYFDPERVLFRDELHDDSRDTRDKSARVIQAAFRRFVVAGDPYLAMPPLSKLTKLTKTANNFRYIAK